MVFVTVMSTSWILAWIILSRFEHQGRRVSSSAAWLVFVAFVAGLSLSHGGLLIPALGLVMVGVGVYGWWYRIGSILREGDEAVR